MKRSSVVEKENSRIKRQQGMSVITAILLVPLILILLVILVFGFYEGRKAYWDYRVREMCAKDGGSIIYEQVVIDRTQFQAWGGIGDSLGIPHESTKNTRVPFFRRTIDTVLHAWNPQVMRLETVFIRRSDNKLLGKSVYYFRRGGDFPSWAHETSYGCKVSAEPIEKMIFVIKDEAK